MIRHVLHWFVQSTAVFLIGLPVTLLGLPLVALGILFRREYPLTELPFTDPRYQPDGTWKLVRLPWWLLPWDNIYDGLSAISADGGTTTASKTTTWKPATSIRCGNGPLSANRRITGAASSLAATFARWSFWPVSLCATRTTPAGLSPGDRRKGPQLLLPRLLHPMVVRPDTRRLWPLRLEVETGAQRDASGRAEHDRIRASVYRVSPWKAID